tara:strand:+ start:176 stop:5869 length:5694 start_codon:yes stop_codon:yes gene_type:complete
MDFAYEKSQIASQAAAQANFDAKKYICGPWLKGARGGPWTEVFKPSFEEALRKITDNFSSQYEHLVTQTAYGGANGPAHPAGTGLAAINVQSIAAFRTRDEKGYGLILSHIGYEPGIKEKIKEQVRSVLTGAPDIPAVTAANNAIAAAVAANQAAANAAIAAGNAPPVPGPLPPPAIGVAGQLPFDWLGQLYQWIDLNLGQARQNGLLTASQDSEFENFKLTDVGINRNTISLAYEALTRLNNQRTVPFTPDRLWIKYLQQVKFPRQLADKALDQLQAPTFIIAVGPNAGQPDLGTLVQRFEEIWHVIWDRGVEIKPQAAPKPPVERSNRVDGMGAFVRTQEPVSDPLTLIPNGQHLQSFQASNYEWSGLAEDELHEAFLVGAGTEAFAFLKDERNCWVCKGFGHTKEKCPSDPKVKRPVVACIQGLQAVKEYEESRFRSLKQRRIIRKPGRSPRSQQRGAMLNETAEPLVQYDDGGIYTSTGEEVSPPTATDELTAQANAQNVQGNIAGVVQSSTAGAVPAASGQAANVVPNPASDTVASAVETSTETVGTIDEDIDKDFGRGLQIGSFSATTTQCDEQDEYVWKQHTRSRSTTTAVLAAVAGVLAMGALMVRSTKGRALLAVLAMASTGNACTTPTTAIETTVYSSRFARSNCFNLQTATRNGAANSKCRSNGTVDTGTTESTSGRRKLFPDAGIEQWHPAIKVEVASGVLLSVEFRGCMVMKVSGVNSTSTKKRLSITIPHSLYVPEMPVTLVSTKALFKYCGIRTYFNDELCFILPDGTIVEFFETSVNYTVLFYDDEAPVTTIRTADKTKWPWQTTTHDAFKVTLRNPLPLTWDLCHERLCHFSPERIQKSAKYITGLSIAPLGSPQRTKEPCISCIRGAFRGHRHLKRPHGRFVRFAQRVYSDSCAMPKSTPFGYVEMYIFYDACTKYLAVYYGKTTQAWEMLAAFKQFITDHVRWMPKGHVEEWYADGGPEFSSADTDEFCREMHTRRRFIAPWNPWMNVAETGWRIILRPLRIILAASNVTNKCWPFAVNQIVWVHNSLSSSSDTSHISDESSFAMAFAASLQTLADAHAPPSPYFNVTGRPSDLSNLRVLFCEVEVRIRSKPDLRKRDKLEPVTMRGINLGPSPRSGGMVYLFEVQRFTTASHGDIYYRENVRPRLDRIVGTYEFHDRIGTLPSIEQQDTDTGGVSPPELTLPAPVPNVAVPGEPSPNIPEAGPRTADHGTDRGTYFEYRKGHCSTPGCEFDAGHGGPCSTVIDATRLPRRPDLTHRDATRNRNVANVVAAVEGDTTGVLTAATTHGAYAVAVAGDGDEQVFICYNTTAPDTLSAGDDPPSGTKEALSGPDAAEWRQAYQRDLAAKIKNGTFTYVPRPQSRVIRTTVAHAHKREEPSNPHIITERRARWVGMGFLQGVNDFKATYCATPSASSCRMFLAIVMALGLLLAKSDVTKAFTLNPIDVELHVEQMPGMEIAGSWPGATVKNTVCLLHKCLEGLKQAGNIWQTVHSAWLDGLALVRHRCKLVQSNVEPTLFIGHCALGLIAILVWVDDILIGFSCRSIYDEFVELYKARFPSKHELGCTRFAGLSIDHKPGHSMTIHQRPHIELAYQKFVTDKAAAAKSSAVNFPAVSDRNSPLHYSKLTLAANETERASMRGMPYLPALATMMYVVHFTLAHLTYHTSFLGQFMHDPAPLGMKAVIDLIIYAYHHREVDVIVYGGELTIPRAVPQRRRRDFIDGFGFHGWSDASWLLRSPAGFFIFFYNAPVDWASKLIRVICHSTAESEIGAGCMAGKRMVFLVQYASEFKINLKGPSILFIDNTATDDLCGKFGVTPRTAHFLRWQHYLRWLVTHRWVELVFVPTKEQLADILTKVVDYSTFVAACKILFARHGRLVKRQ